MRVSHDDGVEDGIFIVGVLVLLQNGDPLGGVDGDGTGGGIQFPSQNPQEGGFARAVGADDAVAVAGQELQINVLEQPLAAELHTEVAYSNHFLLLIFNIISDHRRVQCPHRPFCA